VTQEQWQRVMTTDNTLWSWLYRTVLKAQGQLQRVWGGMPSYFSSAGGGKEQVRGLDTRRFPVEEVSWEDVREFITKLNRLAPARRGWVYRLPLEKEWEYACRGGVHFLSQGQRTSPFYFDRPTFSLSSEHANFDGNYPYGGAAKGPYLERSAPVGSYRPNKLGLYDMHGNVWEWCQDTYEGDSYKVVRGGGWNNFGQSCRAANRLRCAPTDRHLNIGFRLARVPSGG
jgi:formylglycine-generating enzyme required for sulfatase activity